MIRISLLVLLFRLCVLLLVASSCSFKDLELKQVEAVDVTKMEGSKLEGVMKVRIYNPNSFPITVTHADLDLFAADVRVGDAHLSRPFKITANSEATYSIKVDANMETMLTGGLGGIVNLLAGKQPRLMLEGEMKARSFIVSKTVPVHLETELPLRN